MRRTLELSDMYINAGTYLYRFTFCWIELYKRLSLKLRIHLVIPTPLIVPVDGASLF